jgi:hypothetical protein
MVAPVAAEERPSRVGVAVVGATEKQPWCARSDAAVSEEEQPWLARADAAVAEAAL